MEAAVVSAAHGAMGSLLAKLAALLTDKYKLAKEAKGQVMFLKAELESMYVFLKKMSDTEEPDMQDKWWAIEVRELSYDIEDSVNEFMLCVESKSHSKPLGFKGFMERSVNLLTTINTRNKIAKEFEDLQRRVKEVNDRRLRYEVHNTVSKPANTTVDLRLLALHAETVALVGIEGPRDELIQLIDKEDVPTQQLKVLSIVGFGGLGKTTLANEIYRKLQGQYQCQAFVPVSQRPNVKKILRTILSQVDFIAPLDTNIETWDEQELISALKKFLLDKRYFIVIDDIWDSAAWDVLKCALPGNKNDSRVITTTRIETVASSCCSNHPEYIYRMKQLSDQDSRRLFFKRIFGSEDDCPPYLKEVSAAILKKCGGLPLAIITTSSLLASESKKLKGRWEYVLKSLGSNLEESPSLDGMRQILNLSYIHLPHYLKTCMLYMGIYPEDHTIHMTDLARQWVAEGFISKGQGTSPEDVAKSYFNELINRSMIQPMKTDHNGEVLSCRVHDMMLDLILHKCKEENFITLVDDIQDLTAQHDKIRRLTLHLDGATNDRVVGSIQLCKIRTLARFGTSSYLPSFLLFKNLRVLIVEISEGSQEDELFDFTRICHLFQLRYLKIRIEGNASIVLPNKIKGLHQLETLHVEGIEKLPSDIVHMSQLLHLIIPRATKLPDKIGNMKSLRTLRNFDLSVNSLDCIKGLGELTSLTDLEIVSSYGNPETISRDERVQRGREVFCTCLEKLCKLKCLSVDTYVGDPCYLDISIKFPTSFHHLQRFDARFALFSRVPEWIGQLHDLYDLTIRVTEVLDDDFGILGQLPSLLRLYLYIQGALKDHKIIIRGSGFPILKIFRFACSRISCLIFEAGAMAKLERLDLAFNAKGWDRYGAVPSGIDHLSGLKEISVGITCNYAKASNRRAAESAMRDAVDVHPCRPTACITCFPNGYHAFDDFVLEPEAEDDANCSA
ncbi:hypothetical protein ACP4OV_023294 [Aristida adscensionis]